MEFLPRRNIVVAAAVYVVIAAMFIDVVVAPDVTVDTVTFAPSADAVVAVTAAAADDLEANLTTESAAELIPDVQADTEAPDSQRASQVEAVTEATTTTTTTTTPSSLGAVSLGGGLLSNAIGGEYLGSMLGVFGVFVSRRLPGPSGGSLE